MPRMMAYLGGDSNTLAARRAKNKDIRVAVEYPDHNRMLVFCVMQTGEVVLSWSKVRGTDKSEHLEVIGKVVDTGSELRYVHGFPEPSEFAPPTDEPVAYDHTILRVVPDEDDDIED